MENINDYTYITNVHKLHDLALVSKDDSFYVMKKIKYINEIIINKVISHPNIVKCIQIFDDIIIFEYCKNGDLLDYCNHNILSETFIKIKIKELVEVVKYLHGNGIIHRDIKLENILLDKNLHIKLCDFEFATNAEFSNEVGGTFEYYSPEMIKCTEDKTAYYDNKIDIWAIGIVTYCILFKQFPFLDSSILGMFDKIKNTNLQFPKDANYLAIDFIKKILVNNPDNRLSIDEILIHPFLTIN